MTEIPLLRKVDAVTVRVADLDSGLRFYRDALGHELRWRNDETGRQLWRCLTAKGRYVIDADGRVSGVAQH